MISQILSDTDTDSSVIINPPRVYVALFNTSKTVLQVFIVNIDGCIIIHVVSISSDETEGEGRWAGIGINSE